MLRLNRIVRWTCWMLLAASCSSLISLGCRRDERDATSVPVEPKTTNIEGDAETTRMETATQIDATSVAEKTPALRYPLPDGDVEALLKFMDAMGLDEPQGNNELERMEDLTHRMQSRIAAAERILAMENEPEFATTALMIKLESLQIAVRNGDVEAAEKIRPFAEEAATSDDPALAQAGKIAIFLTDVDKVALDPTASAEPLVVEMKSLLASPVKDHQLFYAIDEAVSILASVGQTGAATRGGQMLGEAYRGHQDEELDRLAEAAWLQSRLRQLQLQTAEWLATDDQDTRPLQQSIDEVLATQNSNGLGVVMDIAQQIENAAQLELAKTIYARLRQVMEASSDELQDELSLTIRKGLVLAHKRMQLPGSTLEITGDPLNAAEFHWDQYRGRIVLVDFWATWCEPCLEELTNIRQCYDQYHADGLEVVGVCLDANPEAARRFIETNQLAWTSVISANPSATQPDPNAERYGIEMLPFILLLDRDGNVIATHLRGPRIAAAVADAVAANSIDDAPTAEGELDMILGDEDPHPPMVEDGGQATEAAAGEDETNAEENDNATPPAKMSDEETAANPYSPAPDLSDQELVLFLATMRDKSPSIQFRDGFRAAICEAADQLLVITENPRWRWLSSRIEMGLSPSRRVLGRSGGRSAVAGVRR